MFSVLLAIQILVSIAIIALVMLQQGKGADMGAAFGSGSSGTVFGARGSSSFFTRATAVLATIFFINCLLIASPLVRETTTGGDTIADRLEQQADNGAVPAAVDQAEQAVTPAVPEEAVEVPPVTTDDVPGGAPAMPSGSPADDDLPQ